MIYVHRQLRISGRRRRRPRRIPRLFRKLVKPNPLQLWLRSVRELRQ